MPRTAGAPVGIHPRTLARSDTRPCIKTYKDYIEIYKDIYMYKDYIRTDTRPCIKIYKDYTEIYKDYIEIYKDIYIYKDYIRTDTRPCTKRYVISVLTSVLICFLALHRTERDEKENI